MTGNFKPGDIIHYRGLTDTDFDYVVSVDNEDYVLVSLLVTSFQFEKRIDVVDKAWVLITSAFRKEENDV